MRRESGVLTSHTGFNAGKRLLVILPALGVKMFTLTLKSSRARVQVEIGISHNFISPTLMFYNL